MSRASTSTGFSVAKILIGLFLLWLFKITLQHLGYDTVFSGIIGLFVAWAVDLVWVSVARLAGRPVGAKLRWGVALAVTGVLTLAGPTISASFYQGEETDQWTGIERDPKRLATWDRYLAEVPEPFRRAEAMPRYFLAQAMAYGEKGEIGKLRALLRQIATQHGSDDAYVPARDEATAALLRMYQAALTRLTTQGGADGQLQRVFSTILNDLSTRDNALVYLVFSNAADLADPPGHRQALAELRRNSKIIAAFPRGDAPVLDVGDAFSPSYDMQRRATFLDALRGAFGTVFSDGLLEVEPLPDNEEAKGKWTLLVDSRIAKAADLYSHTREERIVGLLSGLVVNWRFLVLDRDGRQLYTTTTRSIPAEKLHWRVSATDPAWSPYSIMMDSAYYNYAREIITRFGLPPPPEKTSFSFTGRSAGAGQ